jgi:hypothetical protein
MNWLDVAAGRAEWVRGFQAKYGMQTKERRRKLNNSLRQGAAEGGRENRVQIRRKEQKAEGHGAQAQGGKERAAGGCAASGASN